MKKYLLILILTTLLVDVICIPVFSASVETTSETEKCYPTDDSFISQTHYKDNYGSEESIEIRAKYGGSTSNWENGILIKFDLSSLQSEIYITSALLYMYYYEYCDNDPYGRELSIYRVNEEWDENSATWQTRPRNAGWMTSSATIPEDFGWMSWDVTDDVQDYVDNLWYNYGWQIIDENIWGEINIPVPMFYSKEYGIKKPYVKIVYTYEPPNNPPMADAGGPYNGYVNETVVFDGSNSNDTDGSIVGYRWDFTNDSEWDTEWSGQSTVTHFYNATGNYTVVLQIKDDDNVTDAASTVVHVPNKRPEANFSYTPSYPLESELIVFNDSSVDDGEIVSWWWDFGDGHFSNLQNPTHQYDGEGNYSVNLTISDDYGSCDYVEKIIRVRVYRCGDANSDNVVDASDAVFLIKYLLDEGDAPDLYCKGDANGDGIVDLSDVVLLINYVYVSSEIWPLSYTCEYLRG